jgi:hypothetical protein
MIIFLLKSFSVVLLVFGLNYIAQKFGPKISGIISGLPTGSFITLLFFAIEFGTSYVKDTALYNIHGLFAALGFSIGYYISTFYKGRFEIIFCIFLSFIFYLILVFIISYIPVHIIFTPICVYILLLICAIYYAKKEQYCIVEQDKATFLDLILRTILTIFIFVFISILPNYLPVNLAGVFSSFPTVLLPVLIIVHFNHSNLQARTLVQNTPFGLTCVVVYSFLVYITYPLYGVFIGTLLSWIGSILMMLIQIRVFRYFKLL